MLSSFSSGEQRKGSRGPHSFGSEKQEAEDAEKNPASAEPEVESVVVDDAAAAAVAVVEAEPVGPPQFLFDEFIAKRNEARSNQEVFGAVQTRVVEADLSGLRVQEEVEITFVGGVAAAKAVKAGKKNAQRSAAKSTVLDLGFKSPPLNDSREFRQQEEASAAAAGGDAPRSNGGRGGGRGGDRDGGRGGGRGGRGGDRSSGRPQSSGARVNIADASAFPSL